MSTTSAMQSLRVTLLGTGTSQGVPIIGCECKVCASVNPYDQRLRSSALITIGDTNLVIDAGPDFRQQMLRHKVSRLRAIMLTHEHVDHIFGLDDIRSYNWFQQHPTDIYAEKRVLDAVRHVFHYVFARDRYPGIPQMELHQITPERFLIDNIAVQPIRAFHHRLPVLGYRIGDFTYLTDVNSIPDEEKRKMEGTRFLVLNALRHEKHISHFSLDEAVTLAREIGAERTWFTHISHIMGLHDEVNATLPAGIELAYDGLTFEVDLNQYQADSAASIK